MSLVQPPRVILLDTTRLRPRVIGDTIVSPARLTLQTIKEGLAFRGFQNVFLAFPLVVTQQNGETTVFYREPVIDFFAFDPNEREKAVFGISTTTQNYDCFEQICRGLRRKYPKSTIVAGGPHFVREDLQDAQGRKIKDPVEIALKDGLVDAVNVGHAQPFIDFICGANGLLDGFSARGFYYQTKDRQIIGEGSGLYPEVSGVPYVDLDAFIGTTLMASCSNGCGYCSVNRGGLGFTPQTIEAVLKQIFEFDYSPREKMFLLADSNPFERPALLDILDRLEPKVPHLLKSCSLDPSLLVDGDAIQLTHRLLIHGFTRFFFGRETPDGKTAELIGCNLNNQPKTQDQLDKEKEGLKRFIKALKAFKHRKHGFKIPRFSVNISYMYSPFNDRNQSIALADEIEEFGRMGNDDVEVRHTAETIHCLWPFPGTRVRRKFVDYILNPEDFKAFSRHTDSVIWNEEKLGAGGRLANAIAKFTTTPLYVEDFRQMINNAFMGRPFLERERSFSLV